MGEDGGGLAHREAFRGLSDLFLYLQPESETVRAAEKFAPVISQEGVTAPNIYYHHDQTLNDKIFIIIFKFYCLSYYYSELFWLWSSRWTQTS